jgi:hypothetical protein
MSILSRAPVKGVVILLAGLGGFAAAPYAARLYPAHAAVPAWVMERTAEPYAAQRVVYHIQEGGGLFNRNFKHLLQIAENHAAAVAPGKLDLRIVMQGDGVDLLSWARSDEAAQRKIDALKARGVRFNVCRNTLIQRGIDPDTQLYGVARADLVTAAVGEIGALEQTGFVYIKP